MPPAKSPRGKRTLAEADPNAHLSASAPSAKKASTDKTAQATTENANGKEADKPAVSAKPAPKEQSKANQSKASEAPAEPSSAAPNSKPKRCTGPNGELMVPRYLPMEAMHLIDQKVIPPSCTGIDGTPGRVLSTGVRDWWDFNADWLAKHKKQLKLDEEKWKLQAEKSKKEGEFEEGNPLKEYERAKGVGDFDWVCVCRPGWDIDAEKSEDDVESEGDQEQEIKKRGPCSEHCKDSHVSGLLASQKPEYQWVRTKLGQDRMEFWRHEQLKRDQDQFDMHIYSKFSGYGTIEVIENQILAFDKIFKKASKTPLAVWAELEGMAWFLNCDLDAMMMSDDSDGLCRLLTLVGKAVLTTVDYLISEKEFKANSSIKNLGLVLALFIHFTRTQWEEIGDEIVWVSDVVALAKKHGVEIKGPHNVDKCIAGLEDRPEQAATNDAKGWRQALAEYVSQNGRQGKIGGREFDITKMSKAEKKDLCFGMF